MVEEMCAVGLSLDTRVLVMLNICTQSSDATIVDGNDSSIPLSLGADMSSVGLEHQSMSESLCERLMRLVEQPH